MKLKVSFDKNAIKGFLLDHAEKFAFSGVMLCALALVLAAIGVKREERKPENLAESAERADNHINNLPRDPDRLAASLTIENMRSPREDDYRHQNSWNPRLVNPMDLRDEPPVLLVRELRPSAGYGAFRMRLPRETTSPATGRRAGAMQAVEGTRGQRWVVVTGLVPDREQVKAYEDFFEGRIKPNPEPDLPDYIYYRVERAEVDPYAEPTDPDQLKWTALNLRAALTNAELSWSSTLPEVVDERFVHPRLAFPLGPKVMEEQSRGMAWGGGENLLMGELGMEGPMGGGTGPRGPWGEEVAHLPEIPLRQASVGGQMEDEMLPEEGTTGERPDDPGADLPVRGGGMGMPGAPMRGRRPGAEYLMEGEGGMGRFRGGAGMNELAGEGMMGMGEQMPDFLLFRFFDYTVESGKSYRYRVRLMLVNPNYGIEPKFLADPALAEKQWIEKDRWSEPTPTVTVPRDARVLAGTVHTLIRDTDEPSGMVAIVKWMEETGQDVDKDFRVVRGQQLDYPGTVIRERKRNPRDMEIEGGGLLGGRNPVAAEPEEPEKIDFVTEMLVLDLTGGNRLPGRDRSMTEPGRILVMEYDGTLAVLSEAKDKKEYERRTVDPEPTEPEGAMPGMMPEEGMMDDMMLLEGGGPRRGGSSRRPPRGSPPMENP